MPLVDLLPHRVVATYRGAILLDPRAVEHVYTATKQQQWAEVAPMAVVPVSASYFVKHVLQGNLTPSEVRLTCSHRSLSLRGVLADISMLECHFCGAMTWNLRDHVFVGCPAHYLAVQEAQYQTFQLAEVQATGHLEGHESYWSRDGSSSLECNKTEKSGQPHH